MNYSIVISSKTGNTKKLAEEIQRIIGNSVIIYENFEEQAKKADLIFIGFWTDKGNCSESMQEFLRSLQNKKLFLFGTAGFGGEEEYFTQILNRVKEGITDSNQMIGEFMCQGKMPGQVRTRYERMLAANPMDQQIKNMIENFDQALKHPDEQDIKRLEHKVTQSLRQNQSTEHWNETKKKVKLTQDGE